MTPSHQAQPATGGISPSSCCVYPLLKRHRAASMSSLSVQMLVKSISNVCGPLADSLRETLVLIRSRTTGLPSHTRYHSPLYGSDLEQASIDRRIDTNAAYRAGRITISAPLAWNGITRSRADVADTGSIPGTDRDHTTSTQHRSRSHLPTLSVSFTRAGAYRHRTARYHRHVCNVPQRNRTYAQRERVTSYRYNGRPQGGSIRPRPSTFAISSPSAPACVHLPT